MVYLRNKLIKGHNYYYLVQSVRDGSKHRKIEKFIGKERPNDSELNKLKIAFLLELNSKNWIALTKDDYNFIEKTRLESKDYMNEEQTMDFCINFTYNTNAIEENTLTKEETENLLKKDVSNSKSFKDQIESFSHRKVFMEMLNCKKPLTVVLIKKWHKDLFESTKPEVAGKLRTKNVRVAGFKAPHYLDLNYLLDDFIAWYKENKNKLHPLELAAMTHLKFVKIHPFMDGNGRMARLLLNYVLNVHGYPMMTVEYKHREAYYEALDEFDATQEEEVFLRFVINSYVREYGGVSS